METVDPIPRWRRVVRFARLPLVLALALAIAQGSPFITVRDAGLLGTTTSAPPAHWSIALAILICASVLPGVVILIAGLQRGLVLGILGLASYLLIAWLAAGYAGVTLPIVAPVAAWYISQVMGIGWRPHSEQNVRDILPPGQRRVFISYRRSLDEATARLLKQELASRGFDVFLDVDNLGPSSRFDRKLLDEIAGRDHFILLLSPGSLDRCEDENDWIRQELAHALARGRRVIPVVRGGFQLRQDQSLPADIAALPLHNAVSYSSAHHAAVIDLLVRYLCASRPDSV